MPWTRIVIDGSANEEWKRASGGDRNGEYHGRNTKDYQKHKAQPASTVKARILAGMVEHKTMGWKAGCEHGILGRHPLVKPCVVLDPFGGSGTVAAVCKRLGREAVLIEMNPEYLPMIRARLNEDL